MEADSFRSVGSSSESSEQLGQDDFDIKAEQDASSEVAEERVESAGSPLLRNVSDDYASMDEKELDKGKVKSIKVRGFVRKVRKLGKELLSKGKSKAASKAKYQRFVEGTGSLGVLSRLEPSPSIAESSPSSHPLFSLTATRRRETVREIKDVHADPAMKEFLRDQGQKMLLVPEGHTTEEAAHARRFVVENQNRIRSFSEGETGSAWQHGVTGIEQQSDFEIGPTLRHYQQGGIKDLMATLRGYNVSEEDLELIEEKFLGTDSEQERNELIFYFQHERRDRALVKVIIQQCEDLAADSRTNVAVGFFGATHLVEGYDTEENYRTTETRIPHLLEEAGERQGHHTRIRSVNIYIYPHVMSSSQRDSDFEDFFPEDNESSESDSSLHIV